MLYCLMDLTSQKCVVCQVGDPKLKTDEIARYIKEVPSWFKEDGPDKIVKTFEFKDFKEAVGFINKIAEIAESEGHHPNIYLHDYKKVRVELWTHKIEGLHANDFIVAAKIDKLI